MSFGRGRILVVSAVATFAVGTAVMTSGDSARRADAVDVAEDLARSRVREAEATHDAGSPEIGEALDKLSEILQKRPTQHLDEGLSAARRALANAESQPERDEIRIAYLLEGVGMWLWYAADYESERPLIERALAIRERLTPTADKWIARDLHYLSDIYRVEGDNGRALQYRERVGPLVERWAGADSKEMALHLHYLAVIQSAIGDLDAAIANAARAVAIREKVLPAMDADLARSLNLLGGLWLEAGERARAEPMLERALTIWDASGNPDRTDSASALTGLGRLAVARGDDRRAAQLFTQVAGIHTAAFGPGHALVGRALSELGAAQARLGERGKARGSLRRALEILQRGRLPSYPSRAFTLRELAKLEASEQQLPAALSDALEAERLSREHFRATSTSLTEREALSQARNRVGGLDLAWATAMELSARGLLEDAAAQEVLDQAMRSRALVLDVLATRKRVEASGGLRRDEASDDPGLDAARRALPPHSALISYFRDDRAGYVAGVLRAGAAPAKLIALGVSSEIDRAAGAWRAAVSQDPRLRGVAASGAEYIHAARSLASMIWDPVTAELAGVDRVFIVPDGALSEVNFATLVDGRGAYLADAPAALHYLTAERDLAGFAASSQSGLGLLALGDPSFGAPAGPDSPRFVQLPGSRREVKDVAADWPGRERATVLVGDAASESTFKREAPGYRVLHVATHAYFEPGPHAGESPLRVAGLALAGANRVDALRDVPADDGILTAEEIALLDLSGVEWAILSACATGRGTIEPGEGVLGLRRAFQLAGARTLIVSLWSVDDDATRHWMRLLYDARRAGASTTDSVRAATRGILEEQRRNGRTTHPYFWGGFVSVGDWR